MSMKVSEHIIDMATFGRYAKHKAARQAYEMTRKDYNCYYSELRGVEDQFEKDLSEFGAEIKEAYKVLVKVGKILARASIQRSSSVMTNPLLQSDRFEKYSNTKIERLIHQYTEVFSAFGGASVGSSIAVGSWSLVAMGGTASTGTAIAGLHGVAATNAIFAWFGGGALTAGGLGMAGGTLVLGGIVIIPMLVIMSWNMGAKTEKLLEGTKKLAQENENIKINLNLKKSNLSYLHHEWLRIKPLWENMEFEYNLSKAIIYPSGHMSFIVRWLGSLLGRPFFSEQEILELSDLHQSALAFSSCFDVE